MAKYETDFLAFWKYHGAGNDLIMLNGVAMKPRLTKQRIRHMCDRHRGIGADGLICIVPHPTEDFTMHYYNADGGRGSFCGNGSRCAVLFARHQKILKEKKQYSFVASDGLHEANIHRNGDVEVSMKPVKAINAIGVGKYFLDTGSPHFIQFVKQPLAEIDVLTLGRKLRYNDTYASMGGTNVNFVRREDKTLHIRTYERGVESETLACGTGITAAAIAARYGKVGQHRVQVQALGGRVVVQFESKPDFSYDCITQRGPAECVFQGEWIFS